MLRDIIEQNEISKEVFESKQDQIKEEALKRFIENDSQKDKIVTRRVIRNQEEK